MSHLGFVVLQQQLHLYFRSSGTLGLADAFLRSLIQGRCPLDSDCPDLCISPDLIDAVHLVAGKTAGYGDGVQRGALGQSGGSRHGAQQGQHRLHPHQRDGD